jgi:DNA-binding transcriptional ArsR family regulator
VKPPANTFPRECKVAIELWAKDRNGVLAVDSCERIVKALQRFGKCNFQDLVALTGLSSRTISKRLEQLREEGVIRDGTPYSLLDDSIRFHSTGWLEPPRITSMHSGESDQCPVRVLLRDPHGRFAGVKKFGESRSGKTRPEKWTDAFSFSIPGSVMSDKTRRQLLRDAARYATAEISWEVTGDEKHGSAGVRD